MIPHYDAIIVGGRCAGAATAMLLARGGMRVLVLEAARPGTDTLSTHALMRGGVLQLHRWDLLDAVVSAGTPAILSTEFAYGDEIETVDIRPGGGVSALRAPRRTVLDALLLDAARAAGAEVRVPGSSDAGAVRTRPGVRNRGDRSRGRHLLPRYCALDHRRRRAELDCGKYCRRPVSTPGSVVKRGRLRILPRTRRAIDTTGRTGLAWPQAWCRPATAWPACGRARRAPGSPTGVPAASTLPSGGCSPRPNRSWPGRSEPKHLSEHCGHFLAGPAGSAPRRGRVGHWSATPGTSRTPSPRTESPTPCAMRSCSPARFSRHRAETGPCVPPSETTNAP